MEQLRQEFSVCGEGNYSFDVELTFFLTTQYLLFTPFSCPLILICLVVHKMI